MSQLVEPDRLAARLDDADLAVIDASWYLPAEGRDGRREYAESHIPGAVYLDLSTDLADTADRVRNRVASPEALAEAFGRAGIGDGQRVVVYDRRGGYSAGRVWWTLRYAGHERVAMLDGGYERWVAEGHPTRAGIESRSRARLTPRPRPELIRSRDEVLRIVREGGAELVDARSGARFEGLEVESVRHRGHIPGSRNVAWRDHLEGDPPRLRPAESLRSLYAEAGVDLSRPLVTTCGSGVTACLAALALTELGCREVSVYDGSWSEWGDAEELPFETGPAR